MLFWEICLIRWISTEIRVFAYYKNLSLLAAYLGFGLGLLTVSQQGRWRRSCVLWLAALIAFIVLYPLTPLRIDSAPAFFEEFTWSAPLGGVGITVKFYGVVLGIFAVNTLAFVPWGRRIGYYFELIRPIPAYSLNITANLLGIGLFSLLSAVEAPPVAWVAVGILPLLSLGGRKRLGDPVLVGAAFLMLAVTGVQFLVERGSSYWSPYYKITMLQGGSGEGEVPYQTLQVNHDYHQRLLDLRPPAIAQMPQVLGPWALAYELPYRLGRPGRVLVVGAGTGNDVAAALRYDARAVTAVEIDPTILRIGTERHPEQPYTDPRVELLVTDARSFLAVPPDDEPYDIIVFGLLDSHTQISGMTSLRLDNFVYTRESFARARELLHPEHGLLAVSFSAGWGRSTWTLRRLYRMLREVFDRPPELAFTGYDAGLSLFAGPAIVGNSLLDTRLFASLRQQALKIFSEEEALRETPATDDWPFLYLKRRAIPAEHWIMIALIAALSTLAVVTAVGRRQLRDFSWHFFLLGGAFLLIEVKNLIAFSLLFGSTWQVTNLAIGGILVMILLANLVAAKLGDPGPYLPYLALFALLLLGIWVGPEDFQHLGRTAQTVLVPLCLSLPIFCAGLVFIRSFARAARPASALGANIIGGICGGLLENSSLALGFGALQTVAIGLYLLSFLAMLVEGRR